MDTIRKIPASMLAGMTATTPSDDPLSRGRRCLLAGSRGGLARLPAVLAGAIERALECQGDDRPFPAGTAGEVLSAAEDLLGPVEVPTEGIGTDAALERLARVLAEYGLDLSHPRAAAHLQPPPLLVAVAADALASISNASLDTYDSGPSAIAVERWLIGALARMAKLGPKADGVLTPGGSISNLMGLLLARDRAARRRGVDIRRDGVGALPGPLVLCSECAHFSVQRACAALGLGEGAVRTVPTDGGRRMCARALGGLLRDLAPRHTLVAVVATAGTTDFGTMDPIPEIAPLAAEYGVWLHIDAAYGFGALFSERLADRLAGLERADSITVDLHKLGWQPAAASILLVSDHAAFAPLDREVAYLNPTDDQAAGYDGLLGRSLQTTRRPDAVKVVATLLAYGRRGLGDMVDACHGLACRAQERIEAEPNLELVSPAELTTVVFRYRCTHRHRGDLAQIEDDINGELRRRLLERGMALIGRTAVRGQGPDSPERVCLKLTLLNPTAAPHEIDHLLDAVLEAGRECEEERRLSAMDRVITEDPAGDRREHDVIAIGCGPFNLGLAALASTITGLDLVVLEARPELRWHPGLMFEDARLQLSFLADLVTLVDPTHPLSFLAYLRDVDRMYPFYIREQFHPTRVEYEDYLRWAASRLPAVRFSHRVEAVHWDEARERFVVETTRGEGARIALAAKHLVIGIGTESYVPEALAGLPADRLVRAGDYLDRRSEVERASHVTVVGAGQSGAEIMVDLLTQNLAGGPAVSWLTRTRSFAPLDYTKLVLEMTTPAYVRYFHRLPQPVKDRLVAEQWQHYKGISTETLEQIHDLLYRRRLKLESPPVELRCGVAIESARQDGSGRPVLHCRHRDTGAVFPHSTDLVIAATGYRHRRASFLGPIEGRLRRDEQGRYKVRLDHSLELADSISGRIFVAHADLHSHGAAAPDLGIAPYRNAVILNAIVGREVYRLPISTAFSSFDVPGSDTGAFVSAHPGESAVLAPACDSAPRHALRRTAGDPTRSGACRA